jgi:hypothetical protein
MPTMKNRPGDRVSKEPNCPIQIGVHKCGMRNCKGTDGEIPASKSTTSVATLPKKMLTG